MSQVCALLLKQLFFNKTNGFNFKDGVLLPHRGTPMMIFCEFGSFVADEKALKEILCCKGAGGYNFCPCCATTVNPKGPAARKRGFVPGTCLDPTRFVYHTDESVRLLLRELRELSEQCAARVITKGFFATRSKQYGWNHVADNILLDEELGIGCISNLMHDWIHIYCVNGVFNVELQYLLVNLNAHGVSPARLAAFAAPWVWPKTMSTPKTVFTKVIRFLSNVLSVRRMGLNAPSQISTDGT